MKRYPQICSILLFIVAALGFLLSEVYFFGNPMFFQNDFFMLYHGPILLHLLSLVATVGLNRIDHGCARGLLLALAFFVCTVMIGVNILGFVECGSLQYIYDPYNLSLWFSLSLLVSAALTTALAYRAHAKRHPRLCCALLFILAMSCALLAGSSFFFTPSSGTNCPGWYLSPLLLYLLAIAASVGLSHIEHRCARGLLLALACVAAVAVIGINVGIYAINIETIAEAYRNCLALWFSLPQVGFVAFAFILAHRKKRRDAGEAWA